MVTAKKKKKQPEWIVYISSCGFSNVKYFCRKKIKHSRRPLPPCGHWCLGNIRIYTVIIYLMSSGQFCKF